MVTRNNGTPIDRMVCQSNPGVVHSNAVTPMLQQLSAKLPLKAAMATPSTTMTGTANSG